MEICNDIDFPLLSRQYANDGAGLTLVPAWDFVTDGWLHGRMAILRCVESGFSIASVPVQNERTLYDWVGDWLPGWISFSSSLCLPAFHIRGSWFRDPAQRVIGIRR
jgi:predicted amidohydrolase